MSKVMQVDICAFGCLWPNSHRGFLSGAFSGRPLPQVTYWAPSRPEAGLSSFRAKRPRATQRSHRWLCSLRSLHLHTAQVDVVIAPTALHLGHVKTPLEGLGMAVCAQNAPRFWETATPRAALRRRRAFRRGRGVMFLGASKRPKGCFEEKA